MSALSKFIFANSNQNYFGKSSPFGNPRDVYMNGINREMRTAAAVGRNENWRTSATWKSWQTSNIVVGSFANDSLTAYNGTANEVDVLVGGRGADVFVAGNRFGIHYLNQAIAIVADYNFAQGDVVQLSSLGSGRYTYRRGNFGLGNSATDTVIYYNNNAIMALADTTHFRYVVN